MTPSSTKHPGSAPLLLRLAAFSLDFMLAVLLALALRLFVRLEIVAGVGLWESAANSPLLDPQLLLLALLLLLLRDVPLGASPAKWLLCLRLVGPGGRRLPIWKRLLRAPLSLVPLELFPLGLRPHSAWTVVCYSPGRPGLILRTALTAIAAALSVSWAIESIRPSIGHRDADRLARFLAQSDPLLDRELGTPLECEVGRVTRRAHQPEPGARASFELRIAGQRGHQDMVVHARKIDHRWQIEELREIQITIARPGSTEMATR